MPPLETEKKINVSSKFNKEEVTKEVDIIIKRVKEKSSSESDKEEPPKDAKKGQGLKIMTPNQAITRLPILLTHKKAGNNSQKLNNEIRLIIYSLYQAKTMSKTVYNHLKIIL